MRRKPAHLIFGALALVCAGASAWQAVQLVEARALDTEVSQTLAGTLPLQPTRGARAPALQLADAVMLAKAGRTADAANLYDALVDTSPDLADPIARAALYDFAGLNLREGSVDGRGTALRSLPTIEQAKARYRALLRAAPDDWDARYNLERALRLAPEQQDAAPADVATSSQVRLRGALSQDLP